jgi:peptidoglycan biosynthesis protein MviN/MurJ (putative lipid II flippase)
LILVLILIWRFKEVGMGIANSVTAFINVGLLVFCLRKKLGRLGLAVLTSQLPGLAGAALLAGVGAFFMSGYLESRVGHETYLWKTSVVFCPMAGAALIYFVLTHWLKLSYAREMMSLWPGRGRRGKR